MALDYLAELSRNRTEGPDFAATAKPTARPLRRKGKRSLTKAKKRAKLPVKRSRTVTGKRKVEAQTLRKSGKSTMARKKARTAKQKAATAKMLRANKRARSAGKRKSKSSGKRKSAKRAAAGRKAARTRKRNKAEHKAAGKKGARRAKRKGGKRKAGKRKGGRRAGGRSSSRSSSRSNTRIVKQTIVKHVPTGGLLVQAPRRKAGKRKARKGGKRKSGRKGKRKGSRKTRGHAFKRGAMENPMTSGELILGGFTGLLGFLAADVVDRLLATHALTDKGTKDAQGNELYADNPSTTGDYTGLYNATAICAPMDVKRWLVGVGAMAGLPLLAAHFVKNDMARSGLQFFGFAAGVRIVGKGLTDLVAGMLTTNPIGQQLYDGEMRAAALKANNGNPAATALASLPSAGLGRPRLGAAAPGCAPCADKTGAGYPSMPREVAAPAASTPAPGPATQMAPPPAPPPAPPAPAFPNQVSTLTGAAGAPKLNRFAWGDPNSQ
jgi:hypothetical protein